MEIFINTESGSRGNPGPAAIGVVLFRRVKKKVKRGFTLIELLVVIAIIGILATVVIINVSSARTKAQDAKALADITQANKSVAICKAEGDAPNSPISGVDVCQNNAIINTKWPNLSSANFSYNINTCNPPITNIVYSCRATRAGTPSNRVITFNQSGTTIADELPSP
ncbi:MAG: prepilin-type N-terminal cleavage/methylation domain-containing protein [Patescibacteria group bacterium]|nr:prepilin-type N-terminal cleavage/methylation domain-containing protein [Patescibacteria group bacterium]